MQTFYVYLIFWLALSYSVNAECGGAGFVMDDLANNQISVQSSNGFTYYVTPCAVVGNFADQRCNENNAMVCQTTGRFGNVLGVFNPSSSQWFATPNGVTLLVIGEQCAADIYVSEIQFVCDVSALAPFITSIVQSSCKYTIAVNTSLACTRSLPSTNITRPFYSYDCGGQLYNISSVSSRDLTFGDAYNRYWLHLCGRVETNGFQLQQPTSLEYSFVLGNHSLATFNPQVPYLYSVTPFGLAIKMTNPFDSHCGIPRFITVLLQCMANASSPIAHSITDTRSAGWCATELVVYTAAVCGPPAVPAVTLPPFNTCRGDGYNLDALSQTVLTFQQSNLQRLFLKPCGVIPDTVEWRCSYYGAMFCRKLITVNVDVPSTVLARYDPNYAESEYRWVSSLNGVTLLTENSESCENSVGYSKIDFVCHPSYTTPWLSDATVARCTFSAVVYTSLACNRTLPSVSNRAGSWWYSQSCGGDLFNLTTLAASDLPYQEPQTSNRYVMRVCGAVTSSECSTYGQSSFCYKALGAQVIYNTWNSSIPYLFKVTSTGLEMSKMTLISDSCRGPWYDVFRFICALDVTEPVVVDVQTHRGAWCSSTATIHTAAVCPNHSIFLSSSSTASSTFLSSESSESSGSLTDSTDSSTGGTVNSAFVGRNVLVKVIAGAVSTMLMLLL